MEKIKFEDYVMMIRKMAHRFSEIHKVPYDELESQGFLIYCECVKSFDFSKGVTFSTHLFTQLRRLNDYAQTYKRQKGLLSEDYKKEDSSKDMTDILVTYDNPKLIDFLSYAKEYLSNEAFKLLEWIIKRDWEDFVHTKPSIKMAMEEFNLTRNKLNVLWNECSKFWNTEGLKFYC